MTVNSKPERAVGEEQAPETRRQGTIPAGPDARSKVDPDKTPGTGALPPTDAREIDPGSE
ncbi:hypothetical protein [Rhizobium sp. CSW-27]|uniref:hypothetical protein n=1 Tax=Rhizobium sp. CSW-27 TaxID=2839985 RepID=UPI001C038127|nr:hypothetical protein [Rhizobium sp. CSW-27]MBT9370520.1 hypothetical protein [Rhizobium sp. CSW-27]